MVPKIIVPCELPNRGSELSVFLIAISLVQAWVESCPWLGRAARQGDVPPDPDAARRRNPSGCCAATWQLLTGEDWKNSLVLLAGESQRLAFAAELRIWGRVSAPPRRIKQKVRGSLCFSELD
jgi:hypothetical protein